MKLPRDISGQQLVRALARLDYQVTHQTGSHVRLTTQRNGEHHVSVPVHPFIKVGTLSAIIKALCDHHQRDRDSMVRLLFG